MKNNNLIKSAFIYTIFLLASFFQSPIKASDLIKETNATILVTNKKSFLLAIKHAKPGDIIFIQDNAIIDLSDTSNIKIPGGVTLASSRGNGTNKGALIYSNTLNEESWQLFIIKGPNVRISGIRFKGPSTKAKAPPWARCIAIHDHYENIELDHNEFYGWPRACIEVDGYDLDKSRLKTVHIHNNYIHHNLGFIPNVTGLGYGVVIGKAYALIEKNVFDQNRHAIAATGDSSSGYEARFNLVLNKNDAAQHSFDMHRLGKDDSFGPAGEYIYIHDNTFLYKKRAAFILRGKPTDKAVVERNTFVHAKLNVNSIPYYHNAVRQKNVPGNLTVRNNTFNENHQHELAFGDFDGDGATDIFLSDGRNWWYSKHGTTVWQHINNSTITLKSLAFADFNGDGKTDVFRTYGGRDEWLISFGATEKWKRINSSKIDLKNLGFGDFNGDGKTDVFHTQKSTKEWQVAYGGMGKWQKLNTSEIQLPDLALGDFDGDGKTDVFRVNKNKKQWLVSYGGKRKWMLLNSSEIGLSELAFGDFNGDGKTDVFRTHPNKNEWLVSYGGTGKWQKINSSNIKLKDLHFADFNGDGKTDVFRRKGTKWYVSWSGKSKWRQLNTSFDGEI